MSHVKHFENRSQDQRLSMGEQLMRQIGQGEEVVLNFLVVGAPYLVRHRRPINPLQQLDDSGAATENSVLIDPEECPSSTCGSEGRQRPICDPAFARTCRASSDDFRVFSGELNEPNVPHAAIGQFYDRVARQADECTDGGRSFTLKSALYVARRRIGPVNTRDPVQPTGHIYRSFGRINDVTFHSLRRLTPLASGWFSTHSTATWWPRFAASWLS